jgi:stage V sporulation protein D (sporulation-specific penicillin-binding protein)
VKLRRLFVLALGCTVLAGFVARLWVLQVERYEEFRRLAGQQQLRTIELSPPRGTVFDARGRKLAVSLDVESVYATPARIEDRAATAYRLRGAGPHRPRGAGKRLRTGDGRRGCRASRLA